MTRIVINKPPCPLPLLARPARKWVSDDHWRHNGEESAQASPVAEPEDFIAKIRGILFGREQ